MTLHQTVRGSTKDYGTVGLMRTPHAQVLIFPRSLRTFEDRRVIGIDYNLLAAPSKKDAEAASASARPERAHIIDEADADTNAREAPSDAKGEVLSFLAEQRESGSKKKRGASRALAKEREKSAPPSWDDVVEEIARARKDLQKRRLNAARERLVRLENWIRADQ